MMRASYAFVLAAGLFLTGLARDRFDDWITATTLPPLSLETSTEVTDRDGTLLRAYTVADGRWRMAVDLGAVDEDYRAMLIAYEDKRFYDHAGVDLRAMTRAVAQALRNGRVISGGSTLTMQVARLLENSGTGAMTGKARQMRVAWALERRLTKDQILQLYMHLAPFGGNLEGVRAASFAYFGKEPRRLTPAQAALLVAIPQAPESRRPDRAHASAVIARERVLARALRDGIVPDHMAHGALTEPVPHARQPFPALAPHLADRARSEDPTTTRHQLTLKASLQRSLESLARDVIATQGERLQIAIVAADHRSGEILASVGSAAFQADQRAGFVDMTTALRSPGSTLKPLIYGLAFDQGLAHPETMIEDRPQRFGTYAPQNFDRQFRGTIRVRDALQLSLNLPVVQLLDAMGPPRLLAAFDKAAIRAVIPGNEPGLAIGLGGIGISLTDMVQLYAAIARGGVALPLTWRMDGHRGEGQRLLSTSAAWQIGDILAGLAPPPGAPANRLPYKTGTSYGHRDAWAIGYDGRYVVGVWLGRADGTPVPGAFGAALAAPVLFQTFARIAPRLEPQPPAPPSTLLVSNAQLPQPLQRFRPQGSLTADTDAPAVAFPPDGAVVELLDGALMVKVAGGRAPFTWLADGVPVVVQGRDRSTLLTLPGTGFVRLSVIDATGRSARASVRLR
ncbi:MAG: penicillin-binding protein 1C [Pseudotabrizicola sp.]|uniref:penicillin-binding protein 1C n=1 Tax=Pseudotabrizicola sp. TaxID=2939647 RepID=UPI00271720B4|nr:penicillin-binding protein 1C [Pseudotabrizicola sp.]MDO9638132.1 penicillin-binding protein 1C [Pseudotabrizicola sp.]